MLLVASSAAQAQPSFLGNNAGEFLPVQQAFPFSYEQDGDTLHLYFEIADGYYLYEHRFGLTPEHFVSEFTVPNGTPYHDEFFGDVNIFRHYVALEVQLAEVQTGDVLTVRYQGCADAGLCYAPTTVDVYLQASSGELAAGGYQLQDFSNAGEPTGLAAVLASDNLWWIAGIFFVLGIGLAFTPCVFPMYPILSGIIIGQQQGNRGKLTASRGFALSFVYVQGMAITYTLLGIVVALAGMQYQAYLQHPLLLGSLAALFVIFALAMFGVFNFDLPTSWKNRLNQISQNQKGGAYPGVFAMGALSGLIASPCTTAPLSAALLFIAQSGDIALGGIALYLLSLGMGVPLLLIGISGGKLLPKSGQWMNTVKMLFGVLMIAVALFLVERLLPVTVAGWLWISFFVISAVLIYRELHQQLQLTGRVIAAAVLITYAAAGVLWQKPYVDGSFHANKLEFTYVTSLSELDTKVQEATTRGDWVMLDLYADWCTACLELERYTFANADVQTTLENFTVLQADVTAVNAVNTELLSAYQVLGLPTILFFDRNGNELSEYRVTGFMNAERFQAHLESIMER
ncbi:protein-disulfide reductase DsbD [Aliidiomarina haloalkalitolerans]|uniref:Thiol:disulfide interchange protein DsbD n=2 Tax=Aliidiomarina haloalkalitolerans TaxID=859059 RepID=A0A432VV75_9GAMM|nr:protein-disulfide reductase DsbD [Aliidiomarina haloalkalitolerans]